MPMDYLMTISTDYRSITKCLACGTDLQSINDDVWYPTTIKECNNKKCNSHMYMESDEYNNITYCEMIKRFRGYRNNKAIDISWNICENITTIALPSDLNFSKIFDFLLPYDIDRSTLKVYMAFQ